MCQYADSLGNMKMTIEHQLRAAVNKSGLSILQIAKRSETGYQSAWGFIHETQDINLRTAARIAEILNLELRPKAKKER